MRLVFVRTVIQPHARLFLHNLPHPATHMYPFLTHSLSLSNDAKQILMGRLIWLATSRAHSTPSLEKRAKTPATADGRGMSDCDKAGHYVRYGSSPVTAYEDTGEQGEKGVESERAEISFLRSFTPIAGSQVINGIARTNCYPCELCCRRPSFELLVQGRACSFNKL